MEEWEKPRYDQLYKSIPDIWKHKTILYVGAHEGRIHFGEPIREHGLKIDVLEIWKPNVDHLRSSVEWFNSVIEGDVREIDKVVSKKYDVIFWWHGPEHIEKNELLVTLLKLENFAKHYVVLGCPWGDYEQGEEYGNPYEVHTSAFYEQDFNRYGYKTSTIGTKDVRGSNLIAWKDMTEVSDYTTGNVILDGVGQYGQYKLTMNGDFEAIASDLRKLKQSGNSTDIHIRIEECNRDELIKTNMLFKENAISGIEFTKKLREKFPLVNILLFTYDRLEYSKSSLDSVIANAEYPFNLYIVDNHSGDGTVEWLDSIRDKYPNIRKIRFNEENRGLPEPTNDFWRDVETDLIGKVDNDVIVPKGWLWRLVDAHTKTYKAAVIGGYHFRPEDFNEEEAKHKLYSENGVQIVTDTHIGGCCYLMKKSVQQEIGYMTFDPTLKIHGWTEYQHKAVNAGYVVGYLYPLLQLEYMDDPRSNHCLIEEKYQDYTRDIWKERGVDFVSSDQLTNWLKTDAGRVTGKSNIALDLFKQRATSSVKQSEKPYYTYSRPEIQSLVNPKSKRILDVGCATGKLARELKEKFNAEVWGIEYVEQVAEQAKSQLDKVLVGTIEEHLDSLPNKYFDTIIFADVLEHLIDPYSVLKNIRCKLSSGGEIIASIPNVRHWSVLKDLIEGKWEYQDAGILDRTHLKFFTLKSVQGMFQQAGYKVGHLGATVLNEQQITSKQLNGLKATGLDVSTLKEESNHYQYLVKANPIKATNGRVKVDDSEQTITHTSESATDKPNTPLISIIMLTYNALQYTKMCIQSIEEHTTYPYELIFVDNHSTDGTKKYLSKLARKHSNYTLIANRENKGFAGGNNQGVAVAKGEYVMLLNNDVLVPDGWLESMINSLEMDENIGIVGPLSNCISGRQMIVDVPYRDDIGYYEFAKLIRQKNRSKLTPRRRLAGFAMLVRKSVYEQVDGLDETFGVGNFEDDDFCLKVRQKGYALMVDESVLIHHYGSQTFKANKVDYLNNLKERMKIFKNRWQDIDYDELLEIKNPLDETHPKLLENASESLLSGDAATAVTEFSEIIAEDPLCQDAIFGISIAHNQLGNAETALQHLQRLLEINPDHAMAFNQSGLISAEVGDFESAKALFTAAIEKDPAFVDAQRNIAELLLMMEKYDDGIQAYMSILKNYPDDIPTLLRMAQLNSEIDRDEEAKEYIEAIFRLDPDNESALTFAESAYPTWEKIETVETV